MNRLCIVFSLLAVAFFGNAAHAALLKCEPEPGRLRAYVDGFGRGEDLPAGLETFRAFVRAGADEYEMFPEHMTGASLRGGVLRIEARRMLSAGEAAELSLEAEVGAGGAEFPARIVFRSEGREMRGTLRCKLI